MRLSSISSYSSVSTSRLKSIYSDLSRQKNSNPAAFNSNLEWWRKTLIDLVQLGLQADTSDSLLLHVDSNLAEILRYEGVGKPLGLAAVITELRDTNILFPLDNFMNSSHPIYESASIAYKAASYILGKPLWWALEQLSLVDSNRIESEAQLWMKLKGTYVVLDLVERAADIVSTKLRHKVISSSADALYSFDQFRREFGFHGAVLDGVKLSETDLRVLVKFLDRDKGVIVSDKDIIKILDLSSMDASKNISSIDRGILELKTAVEKLEKQVEDINQRINEKSKKIMEYLRADSKEIAMTHLKSRKLYEDLLRKRLGALEVLQSTLIQVETAAQDLQIMKQYESSTTTLRTILSDPSLQRDNVRETMDALAEASSDAQEIDELIRGSMQDVSTVDIDEDEIQEELSALIREAGSESREEEELRALERKHRNELSVESTANRRGPLPSVPDSSLVDERYDIAELSLQSTARQVENEDKNSADRVQAPIL